MKELTQEMRHKLRPVLYAVVAFAVGLFLIGGVAVLTQIRQFTQTSSATTQAIRDTQESNTETINTSKATLDLVTSCVTATGKCYKLNQERTNAIVGNLSAITGLSASLAVSCSYSVKNRSDLKQVQKCVNEGLSDAGYPVPKGPGE